MLRVRPRLAAASFPQALLPACGKESAETQVFGSGQIVPLMVHDPVGGRDRPFRARSFHELQPRARFDRAFLDDPEIPACEAGAFDLYRQIFDLPATGEFPTGLPGLRNLYHGRADGKDITDTDIGFGESLQREILAERAADQATRRQDPAPIQPVFGRIGTDRLVDASVMDEIRLSIPCQSVPAKPDRAWRSALEDAGRPGLRGRIVSTFAVLTGR